MGIYIQFKFTLQADEGTATITVVDQAIERALSRAFNIAEAPRSTPIIKSRIRRLKI